MTKLSVEEIYNQHIKPLLAVERLRLIEITARDLIEQSAGGTPPGRHNWMSVRSIAPNLLGEEDAQEWVSRTRREADEHQEKQWKRKL